MLVNMRQLTRLSIKTTVGWTPKMSPAELDQHSLALSDFLDAVPTSLTDLVLDIWIPGGTCWSIVKSFLRQRTYSSPLRDAYFSVEVPKKRRVQLCAMKRNLKRSRWSDDLGEWVWEYAWSSRPLPITEAEGEASDPWPFADTERRSRTTSWELSYNVCVYRSFCCASCDRWYNATWMLDGHDASEYEVTEDAV